MTGPSAAIDGMGVDEIWEFNSTAGGEFLVTVTPDDFNAVLYAFGNVTCSSAECVGWINENNATAVETMFIGTSPFTRVQSPDLRK